MTLAERTITAAAWNYAGTAARIIGQLIAQILLARMVGPQAFGLVAVAILPLLFSCLIVDLGLGSALIQCNNPTQDDIKAVWSRTTFTGLVVTLVLCFSSHPMSVLLGNPQAESVIRWLAPVALLHGLTVAPLAMLRRQLDMKRIQFAQLSAYLSGFMGVGVISAWSGAEVWALVAAWLTFYIISFVMLLYFSKLRLSLGSPFQGANYLKAFARSIMFTNLFNWTVENLDNLAIGKFFGAQALGLYSISYNLTRTPANHIVASLQAALFPASARMQDDVENLRRGYLAVVSAISLLAIPVFLSMAAVSHTLVLALFGDKWQGAEAVVAPLALAMIFHVIMAVSGPILAGKGNPEIEFRVQLWSGLLFIGLLMWASRSSVIVIAWGVFVIYMVRMVWMTTALLKKLQIECISLIGILSRSFFFGFAISCAVLGCDIYFSRLLLPSFQLVFDAIVALSSMLCLLLMAPTTFISIDLQRMISRLSFQNSLLRTLKIFRKNKECHQ